MLAPTYPAIQAHVRAYPNNADLVFHVVDHVDPMREREAMRTFAETLVKLVDPLHANAAADMVVKLYAPVTGRLEHSEHLGRDVAVAKLPGEERE